MNKTLIIVLAVIVVIGGFFLFFKKSNAPVIEKNQQIPSETKTVTNPKVNGVPVSAGAQMETGTQ